MFMITKTINVNKPFTFRSILKGINQTVEDDFIKRLRVDNDFIKGEVSFYDYF